MWNTMAVAPFRPVTTVAAPMLSGLSESYATDVTEAIRAVPKINEKLDTLNEWTPYVVGSLAIAAIGLIYLAAKMR